MHCDNKKIEAFITNFNKLTEIHKILILGEIDGLTYAQNKEKNQNKSKNNKKTK